MSVAETEVAIIGAGPAGLVLSHLLAARGIDCVVLEQRDRDYVEHRVRAGVLEHPTVQLLRELGLAARLAAGGEIVFEALDVEPVDVTTDRPVVRYRHDGAPHELRCRIVAGCDGFHGVCRDLVAGLHVAERAYPFAWLGILAQAAPTIDELIYANHERGFALYSMRSPSVTRLYLQVPADERIEEWPDDRIWAELDTRLPTGDDFKFNTGPLLEKGITAMRSYVATPMRHGNLLLAGDAAHIVPPTGAKGMNLAIADVAVMAGVVDDALRGGRPERLAAYTETCLQRVWRAQHFSYWMTSMLHRFGDDPFQHQLQLSELALVTGSVAAATSLAQNYVGFPFGELYPGAERRPGARAPAMNRLRNPAMGRGGAAPTV